MKAVPMEPSELGAFFNGDSYLVLSNRGVEGADLHMWIGGLVGGSLPRYKKRLREKGAKQVQTD